MASMQAFVRLKEGLNETSAQSRIDPFLSNKRLHDHLSEAAKAFSVSIEPALFKDEVLAVLEEVCLGKKVSLTRSFQVLLRQLYELVIKACPGYVARNVLNSMVNVCNSKLASNPGRETALQVISGIFRHRLNDTASQVTDALQLVARMLKLTDTATRVASVQVLIALVGSETRSMHDIFAEVYKMTYKLIFDKATEMRLQAALLVGILARHSNGFTAISAENLQTAVAKGLEDDDAHVQDVSAQSMAAIYEILVMTFIEKQEQSKIGAARGSDDTQSKQKPPPRLSTLSKLTSTRKAIVEESNDFKTILDTLCKLVKKSSGALKVGYIFVLGYCIHGCLDRITVEEFEAIGPAFLMLAQEGATQLPTFEEQVLLRTRLSFAFRTFFLSALKESQLLAVASQLLQHCSTADAGSKTDVELQFTLVELNHLVGVLGSASTSLQDEAAACANMHLRHASFGVRTAAANILLSLALTVPGLAADFLSNALTNTRTQSQQLLQADGSSDVADSSMLEEHGDDIAPAAGSAPPLAPPSITTPTVSKKSSVMEVERMQRMYFFHGHALLVALLLKHAKRIPNGVPSSLVDAGCSMGLELMTAGSVSSAPAMKPVICSINRAGALITSSFLSLGYHRCQASISRILRACSKLLNASSNAYAAAANAAAAAAAGGSRDFQSGQSSPVVNRADEVLYEIMTVEAGLVAVTSLLSYCSDAITYEEGCLAFVVDSLEASFRNLKNKYQPHYRTHFRFRTFHTILLECFTLLPAGSYPNSCQQMYVEALRVFRDSITAGLECSSEKLTDHTLLSPNSQALFRPLLVKDAIVNEKFYVLKLESNCSSLQKKECEAFLAIFGKETETLSYFEEATNLVHQDDSPEYKPQRTSKFQSSLLDARTLDASIELLAATFSHQSSEYQDKAIQLFSQAASQLANSNPSGGAQSRMSLTSSAGKSLGLFGNEEEKRRREKKTYIAVKNIVCALGAIVQAFPLHTGQYYDLDYAWRQALVDNLYELLSQPTFHVQAKSASALAAFAAKWRGSNIITSVSTKIRAGIMSMYEKKGANNAIADFSGPILALGNLWSAAQDPDVQSLIQTTLFDCLRKADSGATFQGAVMVALATIATAQLGREIGDWSDGSLPFEGDRDAAQDFLETVVHASKTGLANFSGGEEAYGVYMISLVHQLCRSIALAAYAGVKEDVLSSLESLLRLCWVHVGQNEVLVEEFCKGTKIIAQFDLSGRLTDFLSSHCTTILQRGNDHSLVSLYCTIETLRLMVGNNKERVVETHFHGLLLSAAEWCVTKGLSSSLCHQSIGLELKSDNLRLIDAMDFAAAGLHAIWQTAMTLMDVDISRNPDVRLSYWLLFARSIALDLTGSPAGKGDGNGEEDGGARHGAGAGAGGGGGAESGGGGLPAELDEDGREELDIASPSSLVAAARGTKSLSVDSFRSFVQYFRDVCTNEAPRSPSWRIFIKAKVLYLACFALRKYGAASPVFTDILAARSKTNELLAAANHSLSAGDLLRTPCYAGLLLTDLVNLACACTTFTLNDKPVLSFQLKAMHLLLQVVRLFAETADPDHIASAEHEQEKILVQSLSQILGAVRTCLPIRFNPEILRSTSEVLSILIARGLLKDKVILKRILKPYATYCAEELRREDASIQAMSKYCDEQVAFEEQIVMASSIASFLYPTGGVGELDKSTAQAVASVFADHLADLLRIWTAVVVDSLRIAYHQHASEEERKAALHPSRGGKLYSAHDAHRAKAVLFSALPAIAHALLIEQRVAREDVQSLFLLVQLRLEELAAKEKEGAELPVHESEFGALLQVLEHLASKDLAAPFSVWQSLLTTLLSHSRAVHGAVLAKVLFSLSANATYSAVNLFPLLLHLTRFLLPAWFADGESLRLQPAIRSNSAASASAEQDTQDASALRQLLMLWARSLVAVQAGGESARRDLVFFGLRLCLLLALQITLIGRNAAESSHSWSIVLRLFDATVNSSIPAEESLALAHEAWTMLDCISEVADQSCALEHLVRLHCALCAKTSPPKLDEHLRSALLASLVHCQEQKDLLLARLEAIQRSYQGIAQRATELVFLQAVLLPYVLAVLPAAVDSDLTVLLLRVVMLFYGSVSTMKEGEVGGSAATKFFNLMLPAFSQAVNNHSNDYHLLVLLGRALTVMARQNSEEFRNEIGIMTDVERNLLQAAMKAALLADQQQQQQGGGSISMPGQGSAGAIKLNMDKYRK